VALETTLQAIVRSSRFPVEASNRRGEILRFERPDDWPTRWAA